MKSKAEGVVYILTNPSFPEYVKIGYADDIERRLKDLNRSECIPYAFRVFATYRVSERLSDVAIHNMIDSINPHLRAIETFDGKKRKKEFYAMTADDAYAILETIAKISGTTRRLRYCTPEGHEIIDEKNAADVEDRHTYSESEHLERATPNVKDLYAEVRSELLKFGQVNVDAKKLYIAFKAPRNFVDCEIQKNGLKFFINLAKGNLNDPESMAEDVSGVGHWGNGDYRVYLDDKGKLDYALSLFRQAYDAQRRD